MAQLAAQRKTVNITANKLVIDMAADIALLVPSENPFLRLLKAISTKTANARKVEWLEEEPLSAWDAINNGAGYDDAAVEMVVDDGTKFTANMLVRVPRTGEVLLVTNVATNTLTVTRAWGETSAAALVDNDPLLIIGTAYKEGAADPSTLSTKASPKYNYTQIFRTPFSGSASAEHVKMYGGVDRSHQRKLRGIDHALRIERQLLYGELKADATDGRHTFRGVIKWISTNVTAVNGLLSEDTLEDGLGPIFKYSSAGESYSRVKFAFCSAKALNAINYWGRSKLQTRPTDKTYGIQIAKYLSSHGVLNVIYHPLLEGDIYGKYMVVVDLTNILYRPLEGRDTKLITNIQSPSTDGWMDEFKTESSVQVQLEKSHGLYTGIQGGC